MHGILFQCPAQRSNPRKQHLRISWLLAVVAAAVWTLGACTGIIADPGDSPDPSLGGAFGSGPGSTKVTGKPGTTAKPGDPTAPINPAVVSPTTAICTAPTAAPAPLTRLTNLEYHNTLVELFPGIDMPQVDLPTDNVVQGFDNNAKAQTPSTSLIEQYRSSARAVGDAVVAHLDVALPCSIATAAAQTSCGKQWIDAFVPRAYRRPITADERTRLQGLLSSASSSYGFNMAVSMVVQAVLQSPKFLYRMEFGAPAKDGIAQLTGPELASRLSYFFWDTMPDDELTDAANSGALDNASGVETQARRLLDDPKAHAAVATFLRQWLRFDKMDRMEKSATAYPSWNEQVAESLRTSTEKFVDRVFWNMDGSLKALLTDTSTYVDANIAPIYGIASKAPATMTLMDTDKAQRSGILTQAGLMAAFAHETTDSPVLRGVFVLDRLLCSAPPPPPPGVTGSITDTSSGAQPMTTRDRFAMTHEAGECAACHHTIDGFGFGFEHYDAIGKWRETENGIPVNAKGWIDGTRDANGVFDGAVELGQRLAGSGQVSDCVASQWFRYSLGLGTEDVATCDVAAASKAFADSQGDMRELMIATVTSDAFRRRPEVKP